MDGGSSPGPSLFHMQPDGVDGRFRLAGELDLAVSTDLVEALRPAVERGGDVTLDLSALRFLDSRGVWAFVAISRGLGDRGTLMLSFPGGEVLKVLELVGADRFPNVTIAERDGSTR